MTETTASTPSRQVELVWMFPLMRPATSTTAKPSNSKNAFKHNLRPIQNHKHKPKVSWTHTFVCLADKNIKFVLSREEKRILKEAGLGEKRLCLLTKMVHWITSETL